MLFRRTVEVWWRWKIKKITCKWWENVNKHDEKMAKSLRIILARVHCDCIANEFSSVQNMVLLPENVKNKEWKYSTFWVRLMDKETCYTFGRKNGTKSKNESFKVHICTYIRKSVKRKVCFHFPLLFHSINYFLLSLINIL